MNYKDYLKGLSKVNTVRLAMWAALLAVVAVAGIAVMNSGLS
jgi:hypothetical protein